MTTLYYDKTDNFHGYTWMSDIDENQCIDFMNSMFKTVFPTLIELGMIESSMSLTREEDGKLCVELWNENHFGSELRLTTPLKPMLLEYCDDYGRDGLREIIHDLQEMLSEFQATLDAQD